LPGEGSVPTKYFVIIGHNHRDGRTFVVTIIMEISDTESIASALPKELVFELAGDCFYDPVVEEIFFTAGFEYFAPHEKSLLAT
jgi:hypothetical protein